jgi:DNA polymerase III gamma/tau subunit
MANRNAFSKLFGNETVKEALMGFTDRRAFPNSLLISGPVGSGKTTVARLAALSIACQGQGARPCLACEACRKISSDISPDVITVGVPKDRRSIGVEAVREIRETAYIKPNDLSVKIYTVRDADKMTDQAQNALLKLFEEPPHGVYFLLLASDVTAMLPTVRSRAPELRCELFDHRTLEKLLIENSKKAEILARNDPVAFRRILHAAAGSYGRALELIEGRSKKTEKGFTTAEEAIRALSISDKAGLLLLLLGEAAERDAFADFLRLLSTAMRDMTAARRCESVPELLFFPDEIAAADAASSFTLPALLRLHSELERLSGQVSDVNVNLRTAAIVTADRLWELK